MTTPRAKKRFGQHFLTDRNVVGKIVSASAVGPGDTVLEIGPGTGLLTEALLETGATVVAVELDRDLAGDLEKRFAPTGRFELIEADALGVSFTEIAAGRGPLVSVSNLPYNISGPLTARIIEERDAFTRLVLMYQKEVGRRLTAGPGTKDYGSLSVVCQTFADVRRLFDVSPGSFSPPPKVTSTVISMTVLDEPRVEVGDEDFFIKVVRAAFGQRRKTLANALRALGLARDEVTGALHAAGVDPGRRGETLTLEEFSAVARELQPAEPGTD